MATGKIKTLVRDRGFGFIQAEGSSEWVSIASLAPNAGPPQIPQPPPIPRPIRFLAPWIKPKH